MRKHRVVSPALVALLVGAAGCARKVPRGRPAKWPAGAVVVRETTAHMATPVGFTPDGRHLALSRRDQSLFLCDVATGETIEELGRGVAVLSPQGKLAAWSGHGVSLWDLTAPLEKHVFTWRSRAGHGPLAFAPDGATLAVSGAAGISLWHTGWGAPLRRLPPAQRGEALAFSPDGKSLAQVSRGQITLVRVAHGKLLRAIPLDGGSAGIQLDRFGFSASGRSLAIREWHLLPSPREVAGAREAGCVRVAGSVRVYDVATGKQLLLADQGSILSGDRRTLIEPKGDGGPHLALYDLDTGKPKHTIRAAPPAVSAGGVLVAQERVFVEEGGRRRQAFGVWSTATGEKAGEFVVDDRNWRCLAMSPDGRLVLLDNGWDLCVADWASGDKVAELRAPPRVWSTGWYPVFSSDSTKLAIAAYGVVRIVDLMRPAEEPDRSQ